MNKELFLKVLAGEMTLEEFDKAIAELVDTDQRYSDGYDEGYREAYDSAYRNGHDDGYDAAIADIRADGGEHL